MSRDNNSLFSQAKEATNRKYMIFDTKQQIKRLSEKLGNLIVVDEAEDVATFTRDFVSEFNKKYSTPVESAMTPFSDLLTYDELNELPDLIAEYMHDMRIGITDDEINKFENINDVVIYVSNNTMIDN